jgi:hypothetical protein
MAAGFIEPVRVWIILSAKQGMDVIFFATIIIFSHTKRLDTRGILLYYSVLMI